MQRRRIARLNEQLKRELTEILRHEVRDPRVGNLTLTAVQTAPDLSVARVYIQTLGEEADTRTHTLEGLRAASPYVRGELGRRLHIRRAPELIWQWDDTLEHARRIESLLAQVRPPEEDAESSDTTDEESADGSSNDD